MKTFAHHFGHHREQKAPQQQLNQSQPTCHPSSYRNIFQPMIDEPPCISTREDHPVSRKGICIRQGLIGDPHEPPIIPRPPPYPLETNKFYANLFLGEQSNSVWTHPYSLCWAKGSGNAQSWGVGISHIEREQIALGPPTSTGASQYVINPIGILLLPLMLEAYLTTHTGIHSMILSAHELGRSTSLTTDSLQPFSVNANLAPATGTPQIMTLPLVQGMGFVTALYRACTPLIQTSVFFRELRPAGIISGGITSKYRVTLEDGKIHASILLRYIADYHCREDMAYLRHPIERASRLLSAASNKQHDNSWRSKFLWDCPNRETSTRLRGCRI